MIQSNYIPWKGYFDIVNFVDEFVIYDAVQYTRRDWRNRNRIKTPQGLGWLTIPVEVKGNYHQRISETRVSDARWGRRHWRTLSHNYARAPFFREYRPWLEELYVTSSDVFLTAVNERFIRSICGLLGIDTRISRSPDEEGSATTGRHPSLPGQFGPPGVSTGRHRARTSTSRASRAPASPLRTWTTRATRSTRSSLRPSSTR